QIKTLGLFAASGALAGGVVVAGMYLGPALLLGKMAEGFIEGVAFSVLQDAAHGVDANLHRHGLDVRQWDWEKLRPDPYHAVQGGATFGLIKPLTAVPGLDRVIHRAFQAMMVESAISNLTNVDKDGRWRPNVASGLLDIGGLAL